LLELFFAFAKMSLAGFGGVLVFAWRGIVDQRRWMTAEEFNATFALCQFRRGPNTVNLSEGSARPITILAVFLAAFYDRRARCRWRALDLGRHPGGAALIRKRDATGPLVMAVAFGAIGLLRQPLPAVLLVAAPGQHCDCLGETKEPS
jgi:chromate transporter